MSDDDLMDEATAAAGRIIRALAGIAEEHGDPLVIAVTFQVLAAKALQADANRKAFVRAAGKAYDTVSREWAEGRA